MMASKSTVEGFFCKARRIVWLLNFVSKPKQVYNIDETGLLVVNTQTKLIFLRGAKHVSYY